MKGANIAKNIAQSAFEPLEALTSQTARPMLEEAGKELGSFFGAPKGIGRNPKAIAQEDLQRARNQQKLEELSEEDDKKSNESVEHLSFEIQNQYRLYDAKTARVQEKLSEEMIALQEEVVKLAKTAGVETKAHLQRSGKKVGILDIKILTTIVRFLRLKAEESKSAQELVSQRSNAKRTTGMLAWVSGKQMKVHEQGTLQLQG
ncbi:hypothetical protein A2693_03655 [Candidatus Curtissbacteria bacterium RIFCSPHIGHO2_01_FULL_40_12]|uniref:Uncharacterized protein n=1 Tax=Candidatus Curtissbacteria bacterium RIFCSPHIGHO2_01_FULL_40_12 TaxID=1797710 RepID=A0A1F5G9L3_9BACT|nr:MAG: hypothetical protein A2693_03655 [Candidatus Curtissbacteria bacterium RIFCSPHIGHO2_01_FULL_40_12]